MIYNIVFHNSDSSKSGTISLEFFFKDHNFKRFFDFELRLSMDTLKISYPITLEKSSMEKLITDLLENKAILVAGDLEQRSQISFQYENKWFLTLQYRDLINDIHFNAKCMIELDKFSFRKYLEEIITLY